VLSGNNFRTVKTPVCADSSVPSDALSEE